MQVFKPLDYIKYIKSDAEIELNKFCGWKNLNISTMSLVLLVFLKITGYLVNLVLIKGGDTFKFNSHRSNDKRRSN